MPFLAGGTVYARPTSPSPELLPPRPPEPLEGCFGLEGTEIVLTNYDGREWSAYTNRAGNFYFESKDIDIALPYQTTLRYWNEGKSVEIDIITTHSTTPQKSR